MSSEKVVHEDLRKPLQKVPASYRLYIFLQLDGKKKKHLTYTAFSTFFFLDILYIFNWHVFSAIATSEKACCYFVKGGKF